MIAGFSLDSRPMIGERGRAVVLASTIGNEGLSTVMNIVLSSGLSAGFSVPSDFDC